MNIEHRTSNAEHRRIGTPLGVALSLGCVVALGLAGCATPPKVAKPIDPEIGVILGTSRLIAAGVNSSACATVEPNGVPVVGVKRKMTGIPICPS